MQLEEALKRGLHGLNIELPAGATTKLLTYLHLLLKWNRKYNLTSVHEMEGMLYRHALDCLSILPHVQGPRVLDVGTGAGLPGLLLALARPDWQLTLLDSNAKKTRFVTQAVIELQIDNAEVVCSRVELFRPEQSYDTVVARAYSSLLLMYRQTSVLCAPHGCLLAMKGVLPVTELAELEGLPLTLQAVPLQVPGLDAERHAVVMRPQSPVP